MVYPEFQWKNNQDMKAATRKLQELEKATDRSMEAAMEEATLRVMADARRNCPVDTGRLRASIETQVEVVGTHAVTGRIGTNVEYAEPVEYGPDAPAFLQPAVVDNRSTIQTIFQEAVNSAVREVS